MRIARTGDGHLFSINHTAEHRPIWIITNAIRGEGEGQITTVLYPDDYGDHPQLMGSPGEKPCPP